MINCVQILAYDESYSPPEQPVLSLAKVGDTISIEIALHDETYDTRSSKTLVQMGVRLVDLEVALQALVETDG